MKRLILLVLISINLSLSLTLEEALSISEKNNIEIITSEYDLLKLEEDIREAKAGIYPVLSLSASYLKWDPEFISSFIPEEQKEYRVSLTQPIFNKVVFEAVRLAKKGVELQKAVIEDIKSEIRNQTRKMYFSLAFKRGVVEVKRETLNYWKERKKLIKEMYEKGIVTEIDYLRVDSQEKIAEYEYLKAKQDYENSKRDFGVFIGYEGEFDIEYDLSKEDIKVPTEETVLNSNTTLKVALKTLELYEGQERAYKSNYYPKLSAFFNYQGRNYIDFEQLRLVEKFKSGYSYGVKLDWVIFDGFNTKAKVAKSHIEAVKQREKIKDLKRKLKAKLKNLSKLLEVFEAEIKAWKSQLTVAERTLNMIDEKYQRGMAKYIDVLEARKTYDEVKIRYLSAVLNFNLTASDIIRLLGK